ncbi:hypothetical protein NDU88_006286 [Pleurodeles waltl]|uniref:Uncharacterized protein n=1 Tax=Pleurodeles waltl TaxID=8319 RepID=A0AAV7ULH9_PLEWA|nr:hypothetical protein NDU88_006286 [Pleurodeles waltl]
MKACGRLRDKSACHHCDIQRPLFITMATKRSQIHNNTSAGVWDMQSGALTALTSVMSTAANEALVGMIPRTAALVSQAQNTFDLAHCIRFSAS